MHKGYNYIQYLFWAPRCPGPALVVVLRAEQTPGLVCVAKPTEVRARPPPDPPHCNADIHPAPSPLHLPVVALGEALVTQHLGNATCKRYITASNGGRYNVILTQGSSVKQSINRKTDQSKCQF